LFIGAIKATSQIHMNLSRGILTLKFPPWSVGTSGGRGKAVWWAGSITSGDKKGRNSTKERIKSQLSQTDGNGTEEQEKKKNALLYLDTRKPNQPKPAV